VALVARADTGQLDIQASGLAASGIVDHFELSFNKVDTAVVASGQWLSSAANTAVYGTQQTVFYRACRDTSATYCGEWSDAASATPLNARAAIESCTAPSGDTPGIVRVIAPSSGGQQSVSYQASFNRPQAGVLTNWEDFATYTEGDPVPSGTVGVRIRATVSAGGDPWSDPAYVEATCTPTP